MSKLGEHFRQVRLSRGLSVSQLAALVGYRNLNKGSRRISAFESSGQTDSELLQKLTAALSIDAATVEQLTAEDHRVFVEEWTRWADEPITPYLVVRLMPAIYCPLNLPDDIKTVEQAEAWAQSVAAQRRMRCCLVLSRRISVWIGENGQIYSRTEAKPGHANSPFMRLGGDRRTFLLDLTSDQVVRSVQWPRRSQ